MLPQGGLRNAWYVVLLLTATQIVSYIDRFLPSLLLKPIKEDLALTDFQIGLLMGPAFDLFYVLVTVPIGWLADHWNRRAILAGGITLWCAMTCGGAFVRSFLPLFGMRLGAGAAFLVVGLPGFLLALLMFTVREPIRTERVRNALRTDAAGNASLGAAFGFIRERWRSFGALMLGSSSMVVIGSLTYWNVALFERTWGWGVRDVGLATGVLLLGGGTIGTLLSIRLPIAGSRRAARTRRSARCGPGSRSAHRASRCSR